MADLSAFPITQKWAPTNPDLIQLYSFPTPNGVKASIALEELGLPYEPHLVRLGDEFVKSDAFTSLNPNGKIPAIIDPDGPGGRPMGLFESGAILIYLAEKTGKLLGETPADRHQVIQWVMFQMGGVGPMFGQLGHFHKMAKEDVPYAKSRYADEAKRLYSVVESELEDREWIAGDFFSIADIALAPWLNAIHFYEAEEAVGFDELKNVPAYIERFFDRPAAQKGRRIPDPDAA
ncbi:glutathione S-transferase family protein [Histidinibacterium aquaticum]|uniref:Glutathione S-transferase n=1 Tax=Histidinibacterium aquaticum TaxID=2613962 RepID=A0A5J5GT58_9RHOB|nr:glutathione binding-like protein [Histidinibacterium aquaticum]KAA9010572.1 glutathione S-transferase [Histidinibacterium aquaticum]